MDDQFIEPLAVKHEGNLVNGVLYILFFDDRFHRHVAETGDLLPGFLVDRMFAATN